MDRVTECRNCDAEFERSEDSDYGGEETCPSCKAVNEFCFETQMGLFVENVIISEESKINGG